MGEVRHRVDYHPHRLGGSNLEQALVLIFAEGYLCTMLKNEGGVWPSFWQRTTM